MSVQEIERSRLDVSRGSLLRRPVSRFGSNWFSDSQLQIAPQTEARIEKSAIANMEAGTVSLMPAGFGEQLSRAELGDLLAFPKGTRWGAN